MKLDPADDRSARETIRDCLDESLMVEAAAGTGKTTQLVNRLVSVLRTGKGRIDQVVAVTFTRKAAGELKLRLREKLERERIGVQNPEECENLEHAISHLEEARVGTIHGFCAELLRERPVEAGIDPGFQELSEDEAPRLFERVFRHWIHERLGQMPPALARILSRLAVSSWSELTPLERLRDASWQLADWRDFRVPWRRGDLDRDREVDRLLELVVGLAELSSQCSWPQDYLYQSLSPVRDFKLSVEKAEVLRDRDYDDLEARLIDLLGRLRRDRRKGSGRFAQGITREQVLQIREGLIECLESFREKADAELAADLQAEFFEVIDRYEKEKKKLGHLDFVDLLILTRTLIRDNRDVRGHLQQRFSHIFVDEFQDTDPLQAEILLLLASADPDEDDWRKIRPHPGKLFLVGDPKQSIYRFRRADVRLYQEVKKVLERSGVRLVRLSRNFRSLQPLLEGVNASFEESMDGNVEVGQPDYVPLVEHLPARPDQPSLVALPVAHPYGFSGVTMKAVEECLPDTVAAFVDWMLSEECQWTVRDPEHPLEDVRIRPRHICILFRRFMSWNQDVTRPYVRALEVRGVPHLLVGSRTFHQREEVETLRAALTALEWPDDELSVYATLRGSLFAIPDDLLLRAHSVLGRLHPLSRWDQEVEPELEPVLSALGFLGELHRRRNYRPVVATLNEILEFTRAHAGFALRPAGAQVLANVQRVCEMARKYELSGGISFRGFVEWLDEESRKARSAEAPVLEEGAEGVRIMTLHAAKGLESPVVILADMTCKLAQKEPDKHVNIEKGLCALKLLGCSPWDLRDHAELEQKCDQAEGVRIAYVAATRARDLLVVPTLGDGHIEGWLSPLDPAVYPSAGTESQAEPAPGCPAFGAVSVLSMPAKLMDRPRDSIPPGLHTPRKGRHKVVWWDPALLHLDVEPNFGVRQQDLLVEDDSGVAAESGAEQYAAWKEGRSSALERGALPELMILTPSGDHIVSPVLSGLPVKLQPLSRDPSRPAGRRFGTLVHTTLRDVELDAAPAAIELLVRHHGRLLKADQVEVEAAVAAVTEALRHSLMHRARNADQCRRELPFLLNMEEDRILEGVLDLAFLEKDGWIVVDFKTDLDVEANLERYRTQVQAYMMAIHTATGLPAEGWILAV